MANQSLNFLLSPSIVTGEVARVGANGCAISKYFGTNVGGANIRQIDGRAFTTDIFNASRNLGIPVAPAAAASGASANPVGNFTGTCVRVNEFLPLLYDQIYPMRPIGQNAGVVDAGGQSYIKKQEEYLATIIHNTREYITTSMLKGGFQILESAVAPWKFVDSGGTITVDSQIPAGNKTTLDMLGGGSLIPTVWSNTSSATVVTDCNAISAAFTQLTGRPLSDIWINSKVWGYVINNAEVRNVGGTSVTPFAEFEWEAVKAPDGTPTGERRAQLRALPGFIWHIYDGVLSVNGTTTKQLPDTKALFHIDPKQIMQGVEGSEYVVDEYGKGPVKRTGMYAYGRQIPQPSQAQLYVLDNFLASLTNPYGVAYGTIA